MNDKYNNINGVHTTFVISENSTRNVKFPDLNKIFAKDQFPTDTF